MHCPPRAVQVVAVAMQPRFHHIGHQCKMAGACRSMCFLKEHVYFYKECKIISEQSLLTG